jgi:probable F420-dependent oxidoreductase
MRFSLWLYPYGRWGSLGAMAGAAARAEQLGFSSISISDHIVCPTGPERDGVTPVWYDFFVLSTYIAGHTSRIRLVGCLVLPYRRLLPMAKQIASLDVVSEGRFTLVACVGWLKQEFEMLGVPYEQRGDITDEFLNAMKVLWTSPDPTFRGRYCQFHDILFEPKCVQQPHVPIWIGGSGPRALRRVVQMGDGWMPMGDDPPFSLADTISSIRERAAAQGRDPANLDFRYTVGIGEAESALRSISHKIGVDEPARAKMPTPTSVEDVARTITQFKEAGFTELCLSFAWSSPSEYLERIEWFMSEVKPLVPGTA